VLGVELLQYLNDKILRMKITLFSIFLFFSVSTGCFSQQKTTDYYENFSVEHFEEEISDTKVLLEKDIFQCRKKAVEIYLNTKSIFEKTGIVEFKKLSLEAAITYAVSFSIELKYHIAHKLYSNIRKEAVRFGFVRLIAIVTNACGADYFNMGYYNMAKSEFDLALNLVNHIGDSSIAGRIYNNLGVLMMASNNYLEAVEYFDRASHIMEKNNNISGLILSYTNLANGYVKLNELDKAKKYLKLAISNAEKHQLLRLACMSYMFLSDLELKNNNLNSSIEYSNIAIKIAKEVGRIDVLFDSYTTITEAYEQIGNTDSALFYSKLSLVLYDSLHENERDFQEAEILSAERYRNKIHSLEVERFFQNELIKKRKFLTIYLLIIIFLILLVVLVLLWSHINRMKRNRLLSEKNHVLNTTVRDLQLSENQLQIANSAKDKFIGILSHDVLTPISSIRNVSDSLVNNMYSYDKDLMYSMLSNLRKESIDLQNLINNILKWVSFKEKKSAFSPKLIDLYILSIKTVSMLENMAKNKEIEIINHITENSIVYADPEMISAVLRNLVVNAIKFSDQKSDIEIYSSENEKELTIHIKDYGVGMSKQDLEKLFRLDIDNKTIGRNENKGTGLGLLLCKEIINMNNGRIYVESEVNKGSIFSFVMKKQFENGKQD